MEKKKFSDLYSRDSKQRIKIWSIEVTESAFGAMIGIKHGLLDGKKELDFINVSSGKNKGKSNETTPFTQAISDAEGRWNKKRREGYKSVEDLGITTDGSRDKLNGNLVYTYIGQESSHLDYLLYLALPKDNTDADNNLKPMKCQKYDAKKAKFPLFGQPKINGFRCVLRLETTKDGVFDFKDFKFRSKNGLDYPNLGFIAQSFTEDMFYFMDREIVFDGEIYIPGEPLQVISSAIRKYNANTKRLRFHIFDLAIPDTSQKERLNMLVQIANPEAEYYKVVHSKLIKNDEEAQLYTDACIAQGYEGAVFRDPLAEYQFGKRPQTITKLKRSDDAEFEILDVILPDNGDASYCVLLCRNNINSETFKSTPEGTFDLKKSLYANKESLKGKMATIKFFERTADGIPFHSTVIDIRDYE